MYDVVTIGTGARDIFLTSSAFHSVKDKHLRRFGFGSGRAECLPYGAKIEIERPTMTIGGGAANAAVTFARHGLRAAAAVKLGMDQDGKAVADALRAERIAVHAIEDRGRGTAWSCIIVPPDGERTILHYRGASSDLEAVDIPFDKIKARWAYLVPGHVPLKTLIRIVRALKKNKTRIAFNPSQFYVEMGLDALAPILKACDVILVNREEAAALTRLAVKGEKRIFNTLHNHVDGLVAMTDGPRGVRVSDGKNRRIYRAGVFKEKILVDRTGSGDAFGSGFVAGLAAGRWDGKANDALVLKAIARGSANATSVVEHVGAQAGILTSSQFEHDPRWRGLHVAAVKR
jgi:sugar/nucleoside kinase (ribokinase family)